MKQVSGVTLLPAQTLYITAGLHLRRPRRHPARADEALPPSKHPKIPSDAMTSCATARRRSAATPPRGVSPPRPSAWYTISWLIPFSPKPRTWRYGTRRASSGLAAVASDHVVLRCRDRRGTCPLRALARAPAGSPSKHNPSRLPSGVVAWSACIAPRVAGRKMYPLTVSFVIPVARAPGSPRLTMSAAAAAIALTVTLLLLEAPGGALAQGDGRDGKKDVLKRSKPTPADLDRSILLEWREGSPQLLQLWSDENAPVSAWEGVAVGAEGRVFSVDLHDEGLTGALPAELGRLTALETLWLYSNQLTSVPAELGELTALKGLVLTDNNELTSVPVELGRLTALTSLYLNANKLTSVPAALGNLKALRVLSLGGNKLTSVPKKLGNLNTLTASQLRGNQLTSVPAELGRLTALKTLSLSSNQLTSVPAELGDLAALTTSSTRPSTTTS